MDRDVLEEKRIGKYLIQIKQDTDATSPEDWNFENENFLVFDHRDFCVERKGFDPTEIFENGEKCKGYHVFRCYAYIHSGVALSIGDHSFPDARWDVSFRGFFLVKRQKGTWTREQALEVGKSLCKEWNEYLSGKVYGYQIFDTEEDPDCEDSIDSCWGYYGGTDYCMSEAERVANYYIEQDKEKEKVI